MNTFHILARDLGCILLFGSVLYRAFKLNGMQVRPFLALILVAMGMSSIGVVWSSQMPPWMLEVVRQVLLWSMVAFIYDDQRRYRTGPPDDALKGEARRLRPDGTLNERRAADRRVGQRREPAPSTPAPPKPSPMRVEITGK